MADGGNRVRLAGAALAEQQQIATALDPVVAGSQGQEVRLADTGGGVEIEGGEGRSEEHTSELQSLMRISYAVFCLKKKKKTITHISKINDTNLSQKTNKQKHTSTQRTMISTGQYSLIH